MARRRINTKFLGFSFVALVVLAVGLILARKFLVRENPQPFITQGDAYFKAEDWPHAAADYGHASSLLPRDASLFVKYGISLMKMAGDDPENIRGAAGAWRHAVELDPDNKQAWGYLLDAYLADLERLEALPKNDRTQDALTQYFTLIRQTAGQIMRLDPKNNKILSVIPELNIRLWLLDISLPLTADEIALPFDKRPTDDQKIASAILELTHLLHDDPGNSQAAWWIAHAKYHQAQLLFQKNQQADAYSLMAEAAGTFDDPIMQKPDNVIDLYLGQAQMLGILMQTDPRVEMRANYSKKIHAILEKAQAIVDPKKTQQYIAVKLVWAHDVAGTDPGRAEQIFRDVIAKNPDDPGPKIELANVLKNDATRRKDALALLDQIPDAPPASLSVVRKHDVSVRILQGKLLKADILTTEMSATQDSAEKDRIAANIQKLIDQLRNSTLDKWRVLKAQGRFQLERGQYRDAIQTLTAASDSLNTISAQKDSELLLFLADAERHGEQTGNAIAMLNEAMRDPHVANSPDPHMKLAQLYLIDHNIEKAKVHVDWLAIRYPDNPNVIRLQIHSMDPATQHDDIAKLYQKLPETNLTEMKQKLETAHELNDTTDAARLLTAMHVSTPDDVTITYQLGMLLLGTNQKDQAKKLVDDSLKLKPNDPTLKLLADAVNGSSSKEISDAVRAELQANPDVFQRETKLAELSRMEGKREEELQHLKAALEVQPKNTSLLEKVFLWYVEAGQFDNAQQAIAPLVDLDADQAHGQLYKFHLAMAKGDIQSALAIGRQLTIDFKEFSESWESLGEVLQASGQIESASAKYLEALDKQPDNVKALRNLIACSYQLGKLDDAKRYIRDARQRFPDDPRYKKLEIDHELRFGDPETVLDTLRDDLAHAPENPDAYQNAANALMRAAAMRYAKGDAPVAKAHISEARHLLETACKKWPDNLVLTAGLANVCAQDNDVPAGESLLKAIAQQPKWKNAVGPLLALADFYVQTNRPNLAEAPLQELLGKTNNNPEIEIKLGQVLIDEQKFEPALTALEQHQDLINVRKMRTQALLNLRRGAEAESQIVEALKAKPHDRELTKLLLFVYYGEEKSDLVRAVATDTIKADPTNLAAYYYRGLANLQGAKPDIDAAISDLAYVCDQSSDNLEARLALSNARLQKGDTAGAIAEIETALRAFPQSKPARLRLLELYEAAVPPRWIDAEQLVTDGLAIPQYTNDPDLLRAAAVMWARRGDGDKALTNIRAAMAQLKDKTPFIHDYLTVLLLARQYSLLLQETDPIVAAPNAPWWIYSFRAQAKAKSGDIPGATKEFDTALNLAGTAKTHTLISAVVHDATATLGVDKTLAMVLPRTQNSTTWKLVAVPLIDLKGDHAGALKMAESALPSIDSLPVPEQDELFAITASLYLATDPPQTSQAVGIYQQMITRHPDDYVSMNNLACIYDSADPPQTKDALKYANQAFAIVKASGHIQPLIYDTEGWAMILDGQVDEGIFVLHQAIDQSDFPDAHYHLAEGYLRKQLPEDANRELDQANVQIDKANQARRPVDSTLVSKIQSAQRRAKQMLDAKTPAVSP